MFAIVCEAIQGNVTRRGVIADDGVRQVAGLGENAPDDRGRRWFWRWLKLCFIRLLACEHCVVGLLASLAGCQFAVAHRFQAAIATGTGSIGTPDLGSVLVVGHHALLAVTSVLEDGCATLWEVQEKECRKVL